MPSVTSAVLMAESKKGQPVIFEGSFVDEMTVLRADLTFVSSYTQAKLRLTVVENTGEPRKRKFVAVREGHTHDGLSAENFVAPVSAYVHTSEIEAYYLFELIEP